MTDLAHVMGNDLQVAANGDLLLVSDSDEVTQRLLRRIMTNQNAYLWHPDYGMGLGARIGSPANQAAIQGAIRQQMLQEAGVAQYPAPQVTTEVIPSGGLVSVNITYVDADTGAAIGPVTVPA